MACSESSSLNSLNPSGWFETMNLLKSGTNCRKQRLPPAREEWWWGRRQRGLPRYSPACCRVRREAASAPIPTISVAARDRRQSLFGSLGHRRSTGSGTRFLIGFSVRRYAYIAFRSSSVKLRNAGHGIGGSTGRDVPMCFPSLIDFTNMSSVHNPCDRSSHVTCPFTLSVYDECFAYATVRSARDDTDARRGSPAGKNLPPAVATR